MSLFWKNAAVIAVTGGALLLGGCATQVVAPPTKTDPALIAMQQAMERIEEQHAMLAVIERGRSPVPVGASRPPNHPELAIPIYLRHWNGPAHQALEAVARDIGYTFKTSGERPAIEPMAALDANGEEAFVVLQNLSDQGGPRYRVRIDLPARAIVIVYREVI